MTFASEKALVDLMGQNGLKTLSTAGTATYAARNMCRIKTVTASTIAATAVTGKGDNIVALVCPANFEIVGTFSSVTVSGAGGVALVYLA